MGQMKGRASIGFKHPPVITNAGSIMGKEEGDGPLGQIFDQVEQNDMFGKNNWEQAKSAIQKKAVDLVIEKGDIRRGNLRYLSIGDLLRQLVTTPSGTVDLEIPLFSLYKACSAMGEALNLGTMTVNGGYADQVMSMTSSHSATAKKQFRFPLVYGNQRPAPATWTVTDYGAVVIARSRKDGLARTASITTRRTVDMETKDFMGVGAAIAPAAFHTIEQNLRGFQVNETWHNKIVTGGLGEVRGIVLLDFMKDKGRGLSQIHMGYDIEIYDKSQQDAHTGGSGCGRSIVTLCSYILPRVQDDTWEQMLFVPIGVLLSTVSLSEGQSAPGIAHGVITEHIDN